MNSCEPWRQLVDDKQQAMSQNFFQDIVERHPQGIWTVKETGGGFASLSTGFFRSDWLDDLGSYWVKGLNGCHWGVVLAVVNGCQLLRYIETPPWGAYHTSP